MNRKKLKEVVVKVLKEMNDEGKYQGYAKVKNTAPFTEDPHTGKSAPPGQGEG